jgi:hypothetical protein
MTKWLPPSTQHPKPPRRVEAVVAVPAASGDRRGLETGASRALGIFYLFIYYTNVYLFTSYIYRMITNANAHHVTHFTHPPCQCATESGEGQAALRIFSFSAAFI